MGTPARAVARFAAAERAGRAADLVEPSAFLWRADHVEALLALGRISDAVEVLDAWEADATRVGREWVLAHATRCRGLVAAAHGSVETAVPVLERAVAQHDAVGDPFGRARALLALGVVGGGRARSAQPATRSRRPWPGSRSSGPQAGWTRHGPSSAASVGALASTA